MIIDTSALIAVLTGEAERRAFNEKIARAETCLLSAASYLETSIIVETRFGYEGIRDLSFYLQTAQIKIYPLDKEQAELARNAYASYGKGKHPASLNFGDCFAYALAKLTGESLLFKGDDFSQTDIPPA